MNVTHVWEWGWDAYTIGMIHDKYSKLITSLCYLLHQCICVCCLNVGEGGALNEIKTKQTSNLEEVCFCGSIKYRDRLIQVLIENIKM